MKLLALTALAVASLLTSGNVSAQEMLEATVPFDFYVGQAAMPSGTYRITPWTENMLMVWHVKKGVGAFYPTYHKGTQQNDKPTMVFHKYMASPAKYFLSEVRGLPVTGRLALPISRLEKDAQATVRTYETLTLPKTE